MNSAIYRGWVRHRRFTPNKHHFKYAMMFLWLDLDETPQLSNFSPWFSTTKFSALSFRSSDYLDPGVSATRDQVWRKVESLGGEPHEGPVFLLAQVRCFGIYFSPVNFFYCYDQKRQLQYVLAEVSNTPWNERHWYLVPADQSRDTPKDFHVSPFMTLDMQYRWKIPNPQKNLCLHIESHQESKIFDATLVMNKHPFTAKELRSALWQTPMMSWHIIRGIYWQALRLWIKRVPFVPYPKKEQSHADSN